MKTIALLVILTALLAQAQAQAQAKAQYQETLQHSKTIEMTVALNEDSVLCSKADYGALFLKILIPDLAKHTLLNHRNLGAAAPCVAAGLCTDDNNPSKIIDVNNPTEKIVVKIDVYRAEYAESTGGFMPGEPIKQICAVTLIERVETTIRGRKFTHERLNDLDRRYLSDCSLD